MLATVVGVFSGAVRDLLATLATAGMGLLFLDGFLVDRFGGRTRVGDRPVVGW